MRAGLSDGAGATAREKLADVAGGHGDEYDDVNETQPASTSSEWNPFRGARSLRRMIMAVRRRAAPGERARLADEREAE